MFYDYARTYAGGLALNNIAFVYGLFVDLALLSLFVNYNSVFNKFVCFYLVEAQGMDARLLLARRQVKTTYARAWKKGEAFHQSTSCHMK